MEAISLLVELDKEVDKYIMRCRERYGWQFPEIGKIVTNTFGYTRTVKYICMKANLVQVNVFKILPEEGEEELQTTTESSMVRGISYEDTESVIYLCDQVLQIHFQTFHMPPLSQTKTIRSVSPQSLFVHCFYHVVSLPK